jgi:uncharacterized SAM-binding protein YcdF (DUF218 family)
MMSGLRRDWRTLYRVYREEDAFEPADAAGSAALVILGTQVLAGGRPSRTLEARTVHAANLYRQSNINLIIPTGGLGEHGPTEAEVMVRLLVGRGVPEDVIVAEGRARSTWESAWFVGPMLRERGARGARLVTDPLHCVRAVEAFREAGVRAFAEPVYDSPMWRYAVPRRGQFVREMGAIAWYRMRHGVGSRSRR